ncbi:FecCD family ABC transporter permease [Georgenia subflava]|uniref:Iron chelate uptake ABC transporter family permease subunit n=1 Tax=Georgenia subflava TaxID=1622177 RepID=A0A6N7EI36_9MICO|nr:iron chelate uptake ABC transporter family permease subunit [Georgenia subflava]MPV37720.1 iron chelate uptake ABC transporter family permease subunit [Georgenia subflava]
MTTLLAPEAAAPLRHRTGHRSAVVAVLVGLVLLLVWLSLTVASPLTAGELLRTLVGQGDGGGEFVVFRLRLPRLLLGALVGVAFALAGALFQTVLRNPLASPDILGIGGGASLAAATAILVGGLSGAAVTLSAAGGAVVVAAAIYLLAWRSGVSGYRFVLVGVGIAFLVNAGLGYLVSRADLNDVREALVWMVGSLGTPPWRDVVVLAAVLVVLAPLVAVLAGRLRVLQLGDDTAGGLGVPVELTRLAVLGTAVALAAAGTAFAGPVAFVAFVCAPIARRMLPTAGLALVPSALVGIVLVLAADLTGQHLLGLQVPVGIVTGVIGAPYLLWLLATSNREGRGA